MANIQGLPDATKAEIVNYCNRQGMTQIEWVKNHITQDLKNEQTPHDEHDEEE